jgi:hypothetical protein
MFGQYTDATKLSDYIATFKSSMITAIITNDIANIFGFTSILGTATKQANDLLIPWLTGITATKIDDLQSYKSVKALETARTSLISNLDSLNFIIKNINPNLGIGIDVQINNNVYTQANITGISDTNLYQEYGPSVAYIFNNSSVFNNGLDISSYDFSTSQPISTSTLTKLLPVFLTDQVLGISNLFKNANSVIFTDSVVSSLNTAFSAFMSTGKPTNPNLKLSPVPTRKNPITLQYNTNLGTPYGTFVETATATKNEVAILHATTNNNLGTTLNFYKP